MLKIVLSALVLAGCLTPASAEYELEIGPDTTVIDGPLNPDGTINYLAYLNEKLSEGVTPENNFAVDVAMSMRIEDWPSMRFRDAVFAGLSIDRDAERLERLRLPPELHMEGGKDAEDDFIKSFDAARRAPWTAEQYPEVKKWLDTHAEGIDDAYQGTFKTSFFVPFVVGDEEEGAVFNTRLPYLRQVRLLSRVFAARAQYRLNAADFEGAWEDVMALRRMGDFLMRQPEAIEYFVGITIYHMAFDVIEQILVDSRVTGGQYRRAVDDVKSFPRVKSMSELLDTATRVGIIDSLLRCRAGGLRDLGFLDETFTFVTDEQFNVNDSLRIINKHLDKLVAVYGISDPNQRLDELYRVHNEVSVVVHQAFAVARGDAGAIDAMQATFDQSDVSTAMGTYLVLGLTYPRPMKFTEHQISSQMRIDLQAIALAIAAYRAERGEYPQGLKDLVPAYFINLPTDFATGKLPVYRVEDGAAIVYSLGINLKDEGGVDDEAESDIVVRIER